MSYTSSVARVVFVAGLLLSLSCGTKDVARPEPGRRQRCGPAAKREIPIRTGRMVGAAWSSTKIPSASPARPAPARPTARPRFATTASVARATRAAPNVPKARLCASRASACRASAPTGSAATSPAPAPVCRAPCPTAKGECSPVGVGTADPHALCRTDAPDTCGQSGFCNGQGGCAKYPVDTLCKPGVCATPPASSFRPAPATARASASPGVAISCSPSKCIGTECVRVCTEQQSMCRRARPAWHGSCGKFGPGQTCKASNRVRKRLLRRRGLLRERLQRAPA